MVGNYRILVEVVFNKKPLGFRLLVGNVLVIVNLRFLHKLGYFF